VSPKRRLRILEDVPALSSAAAEAFARLAAEAIAARGRFIVALTGGQTPRPIYEQLAAAPYRERVAWCDIEFFWVDERAVPPDHPDSNYGLAERTLLSHVALDRRRVHRMHGEDADLTAAADAYASTIASTADTTVASNTPPAFDLIQLGMGADGHTASLFPETKALHEARRWVVANDAPQRRTRRLTFTFPLINAARTIHVFVAGEQKADTLRAVLQGPPDPDRYPAQRIAAASGETIWFLDKAAARRLERTRGRGDGGTGERGAKP